MRWFLTSAIATVYALAVSSIVEARGCCGCRGGSGNTPACPSCPQQAAAAPAQGNGNTPTCPNCPQQTASYGTSRYWSSAHACYLYYDAGTRRSYYWSEAQRSFYPVQDNPRGLSVAAGLAKPPSSSSSTYSTRYFSLSSPNGMGPREAGKR